MTDVKKFLFEKNDFNHVKAGEEIPIYTEEQLMLAKNQSFALGKAEGMKEAKQQQGELIAGLLQKALALAEQLAADEDRREIEKCIETTKLTMKVAHKILPRFALEYDLPEIEHVILQAIEARKDEPRIAVTVPTVHLEALKIRMDALALEKGYAGKVILVADDALPRTDCRVEWADGGAERLYERLFLQIQTAFTNAISSMKSTLEQDKK